MPSPDYRLATVCDMPDLRERIEAITQPAWPEFMRHDPVAKANWSALYDEFPGFQFALLDAGSGEALAVGNSIPLSWDARVEELPDEGWDWALAHAVESARAGRPPAVLCGLQVVVPPAHRGIGMSAHAVQAMKDICKTRELRGLIVPVRPAWKCRYPLTLMERYVRWQTPDGLPFDPWLRTHLRAGGRIIKVCHHSMTIRGTVAEWERWADMRFPESGAYVVPGALSPIDITRDADEGRYIEPNVWVWHEL